MLGKILKIVFDVIVALGALACVLVWLGVKPEDFSHMNNIPLPHWVWLVCGLGLFAVSLGSSGYSIYRLWHPLRTERDNSRREILAEHPNRTLVEDARVLGALPIYHQHFEIRLLEVCHGFSMQWEAWNLFLRLRIICRETVGIHEIKGYVYSDTGKYQGTLLHDIDREWFVRRTTELPHYPYKNVVEENVECLWRKLEGQSMKAGEPIHGWVGFLIPEQDLHGRSLDRVGKLKLTVEDGLKRKQTDLFGPPWPTANGEVLQERFRLHHA